MEKVIEYEAPARKKIMQGVNKLSNIVISSLGPKGHNVIIYDGGVRPLISKDGATIAAAVDTDIPCEKIGIQLIKDVISKVNSVAGDGTTTTTLYTSELMNELNKFVDLGIDPNELRKGLEAGTKYAFEQLTSHSIPVKDIAEVAKVSANGNEEITKLLVEAYSSIGENGSVVLADSYKRDGSSYVEVSNGIKWSCGIPSTIFITEASNDTCVLEEPYIMVLAKGVQSLEPLAPYIQLAKQNRRNIAFIAPYFEPELYSLAASQGVALINSPGESLDHKDLHEALMDLAIVLGTKIVPDEKSAVNVVPDLEDLGVAKLIVSSLKETSITQVDELNEEQATAYTTYIEKLKSQIDNNDELAIHVVENLKDRLARLSGGIAIIHIGALTPEEKEEKIALVEDAQNSIRSSMEHGVLPGGGTAMLKIAQDMTDTNVIKTQQLSDEAVKGWFAVVHALSSPARILIKTVKPNDYQYLVQQVAHSNSFNKGYNVRTEQIEDLVQSGVVDSAAIEKYIVRYAASMVGSFILSDGVITNAVRHINYDVNDRAALEVR